MQRETYAHVQVGTPAPKWCTKIALNHLVLAVGLGPGAEQDRKVRGRNGGGARPVGHGLQLQPLWTNPAAAVSHSPPSSKIRGDQGRCVGGGERPELVEKLRLSVQVALQLQPLWRTLIAAVGSACGWGRCRQPPVAPSAVF